jgi:hypothetical protein
VSAATAEKIVRHFATSDDSLVQIT